MSDLKKDQELLSVWVSDTLGASVGFDKCTKITVGWINGHMAHLETAIAEYENAPAKTFILCNCIEYTVKP